MKQSLRRFFLNESDQAERTAVIDWLLDSKNDLEIKAWMLENWSLVEGSDSADPGKVPDIEKMWVAVQLKIDQEKQEVASTKQAAVVRSQFEGWKWAAAACVLMALFVGGYFAVVKRSNVDTMANNHGKADRTQADIAPPNGNNAVLTLSDGTTILLDSVKSGTVFSRGGVRVEKNGNGMLTYTGNDKETTVFNTLSLPIGSKPMRLSLSDGTNVWLNAESSITYPLTFIGKERKVSMKGEAYFEVAKNPLQPFYVANDAMLVKVLGTHFNVNSYPDEGDAKVTLLEGAVNVSQKNNSAMLAPGQQAVMEKEKIRISKNVDLEEVMAWKEERFYFDQIDLASIMRQVSKYYGVDVVFQDEIPFRFVGKLSRRITLAQFFEKMELTNLVKFKIEGNKVVVSKP